MSPKPTTTSPRPRHPVTSSSNNTSCLFICPHSAGFTIGRRCLSHSTPDGTTSCSCDQERSTPQVGNASNPVTMLDLWVYENRKEVLTFAERLEERKWEAGNSGSRVLSGESKHCVMAVLASEVVKIWGICKTWVLCLTDSIEADISDHIAAVW